MFRCENETDFDGWKTALEQAIRSAKKRARLEHDRYGLLRIQKRLLSLYRSHFFQSFIAGTIVTTFTCTVVDAQVKPSAESRLNSNLESINLACTVIFIVELTINVTAHGVVDFLQGEGRWGWNIFDVVVVLMSLIELVVNSRSMGLLRVLRAFRIVKLFRRFKALHLIVQCLSSAISPVSNALFILAVLSCIYACIGVQLFDEQVRHPKVPSSALHRAIFLPRSSMQNALAGSGPVWRVLLGAVHDVSGPHR